jgi:hypothetical protein
LSTSYVQLIVIKDDVFSNISIFDGSFEEKFKIAYRVVLKWWEIMARAAGIAGCVGRQSLGRVARRSARGTFMKNTEGMCLWSGLGSCEMQFEGVARGVLCVIPDLQNLRYQDALRGCGYLKASSLRTKRKTPGH